MIYQRHLINTLIMPLIITFAVIISLVWLSQVMKLAFIIELGVGMIKFLFLTLAALPTVALSTLPLTVTVACFLGYNYLHSDRELIALSASGFSNMQIASPAIKLCAWITLAGYLLAFYISPASYHMLKDDMNYFRGNYISNMVHEHTFNPLSKSVILYIGKKESSRKMHGIIIFDHRNVDAPITVFAKTGELMVDRDIPVFELYDGVRQVIDSSGDMNQMTFSHLVISLPSKHDSRSKASMTLQEYTISELMYPPEGISELLLRQITAEKHQRFIWPGYVMALVVLSLAIFLRTPYHRTGHKWAIVKCFLAVSGALYLHFTFHNMAVDQPIFNLMCYVNLIATFCVGWWLLRRE